MTIDEMLIEKHKTELRIRDYLSRVFVELERDTKWVVAKIDLDVIDIRTMEGDYRSSIRPTEVTITLVDIMGEHELR